MEEHRMSKRGTYMRRAEIRTDEMRMYIQYIYMHVDGKPSHEWLVINNIQMTCR